MKKILDIGQKVIFAREFEEIAEGTVGKIVFIAEVELCVLLFDLPTKSVRYLNLRQVVDCLRSLPAESTADDTT